MCAGGQTCTTQVNMQQNGAPQLGSNRYAIFPRPSFTCDGRITNVRARVGLVDSRNASFPSFQIWRLSSPGSTVYNRIGEAQLSSDDQVTRGSGNFLETNIILTGDDRIEFQSGDVVGYYHPNDVRYSVRGIRTRGYVLYQFDNSSPATSVDLIDANFIFNFRQPLIQFTIGE